MVEGFESPSPLIMLSVNKPDPLIVMATLFYNFALGVSRWHTLVVNMTPLPPPLRPNGFVRIGMAAVGCFFFLLGSVATMDRLGFLK